MLHLAAAGLRFLYCKTTRPPGVLTKTRRNVRDLYLGAGMTGLNNKGFINVVPN